MRELIRDVRHAFTLIRRHPGHASAVLLTLAVAIGVGTVIIALVDRIVLRPLPFAGSERVVRVWSTNAKLGERGASLPDMRDWAASARSVDAIAMARDWPLTITTASGEVNIDGAIATPQWFAIQSIQPQLGRLFREDEMRKGNNHVAVLSHAMWRDRYAGDPNILQKQIRIEGEAFQIIGVLPAKAWMYELDDANLWLPLTAIQDDVERRAWRGFVTLARLAHGASPQSAKQELATIEQHLASVYPDSDGGWSVEVKPLRDAIAGPVKKVLFIFLAAIGVVLLIACANIANLALAFNSWRAREFAVRYALGAGSGRIARQILVESAVLALLGGALGLAIGQAGLNLFRAVAPDSIPRLGEVAIDPRTVAIIIAVSLLSSFIFGLLPARVAARAGAMSGARTTRPGTDLRRALVVSELALAFVLVIATGLMMRAFSRLLEWNPGFRTNDVAISWGIAKGLQGPEAVEMFNRAAREIETVPGVGAVGQSSAGPLFGGLEDSEVKVIGAGRAPKGSARWFDVSPDYLRNLGVPLLRGRDLSDRDVRNSEPVALINEAMARHFWGDASPIGARVELDGNVWQIVGVVRDVHPLRPDQAPEPEIYWPKRQYPRLATYFIIRTSLPPAALEREVVEMLKKREPALQLGRFHQLDELASQHRVRPRFNVIIVSIVSALAFVLAAIGIYGVMSFSVVSRAREIAIRLAVGASPKRVVHGILMDGGRLVATGLLIGIAAAAAVSRLLASFLFGLSPLDPMTWIAVSLAFAAIVLTACWIPARRAAAIDPAASLRVD